MRRRFVLSLALAVLLPLMATDRPAPAQTPPTAFTYQGLLKDGNSPANGAYDLRFTLFTAQTGGSPVGPVVEKADLPVSNGLLRSDLDFGAVFDGSGRWLEVGVRPGASTGAYTVLAPRTPVTPAPMSLFAYRSLWSGITGVPAGFADGKDDDTKYAAGAGLTLTAGKFDVAFGGSGTAATASRSDHTHTSIVTADGTQALRALLAPANGDYSGPVNLIGGAPSNSVTAGVVGATIGGGGGSIANQGDFFNTVNDNYGTVGGGIGNRAGDANADLNDNALATVAGGSVNSARFYGFVGGGYSNSAMAIADVVAGGWANTANGPYNTIGGGNDNVTGGPYNTIGGGNGNETNGNASFVGGGENNKATGSWSAVLGGFGNVASNINSLAMGQSAQAAHSGTFVWADSSAGALSSTNFNQLTMRAANGYRLFTNAEATTGVVLPAGGGGWSNASDVNLKTGFADVDAADLLEKLAAIPVRTWSYKSQDPSIRHMGPTAQDFRAAFGLGEDEKRISGIDSDGVALAAVQGLYRLLKEKDATILSLQKRDEERDRRMKSLEARLEALERGAKAEAR